MNIKIEMKGTKKNRGYIDFVLIENNDCYIFLSSPATPYDLDESLKMASEAKINGKTYCGSITFAEGRGRLFHGCYLTKHKDIPYFAKWALDTKKLKALKQALSDFLKLEIVS